MPENSFAVGAKVLPRTPLRELTEPQTFKWIFLGGGEEMGKRRKWEGLELCPRKTNFHFALTLIM